MSTTAATRLRLVLFSGLVFSTRLASAQSTSDVPPPPTAAEDVPQPAAAATAPTVTDPPPPPPAAPAPIDERLSQRVDKLEAAAQEQPLKFSGYVQAQYVRSDLSTDGVDASGKPLNKNLFDIRRARFRATYTLGIAEFLINIDAIPTGVSLKEAEASLTIPWAEKIKTKLTAGLFYVPFGYETQESDSVLPFVERSTLANRLFPGSRDLGIRAQGELFQVLQYQLALLNGTMQTDAVFPGLDPNGAKDVVGRLGVRFGGLKAGISGLYGTGYLPPVADDAKTADVDESHGYRNFKHRAAGFDISYQVPLPVLGELALYAEGVVAHDLDRSRIGDYPKPVYVTSGDKKVFGSKLVNTNQAVGYIGFLQHLGPYFAAGARAELFDPNVGKSGDSLKAVTLVAHAYPHEIVRLTVGYLLNYENPSVKNNVLTLRVQAKF